MGRQFVGTLEQLEAPDFEAPLDGVYLLQDYVETREQMITRAEFVGGRFLYAVEVDTSSGFELCPAEVCTLPGAARPAFKVVERIDDDLRAKLETFLRLTGIEIAGIELVAVAASDFFDTARDMLESDPRALVREGGRRRVA